MAPSRCEPADGIAPTRHEEALGVLDLQVAGRLPRAATPSSTVPPSPLANTTRVSASTRGRGFGHHFQLQADAAAENEDRDIGFPCS